MTTIILLVDWVKLKQKQFVTAGWVHKIYIGVKRYRIWDDELQSTRLVVLFSLHAPTQRALAPRSGVLAGATGPSAQRELL